MLELKIRFSVNKKEKTSKKNIIIIILCISFRFIDIVDKKELGINSDYN